MKLIKKTVGPLTTCLLIILFIVVLGYIVRPVDTDYAYTQIETFHSLPENSLEVIIYGSSHAYRGINPMELYEKYGIGAYNYGYHWQHITTTKLFLQDSLMTQKPRIAIIECLRSSDPLKDVKMQPEIYYSRYIKNERAKINYLRQCFGNSIEEYVSFYVPLYAFHDNWNTLAVRSFVKMKKDSNAISYMGFAPSDKVDTSVEISDYYSFEQLPLSDLALEELDSIMELCRKNNIEVIFYTAPYQGEYNFGDAMEQYAEKNDCVYLDLFKLIDDVGIDDKTDFCDPGHLNTSGANKVADYIGRYIVDNYDITDMRTIDNNLWE